MSASLRTRAEDGRESFRSWIGDLNVPKNQRLVLTELVGLMDEREFIEGRAACVTYEAALARRTGLEGDLPEVLDALIDAELLTRHKASAVFNDDRPGVVLRIRHPEVVLTVEAAGTLWIADSWVRKQRPVVKR
ncbi:hypothetical protein LN996_07210 [Arthrobacter sp. AK01]|uniref:hypothetical protein n=1 Tax=Arthrobacter sp. AK01 TaxID=2894084 RepID=UPI001E65443C|nr:hypothetical protein [Arthrobacter sp. AK01]MCD4850594.1 hypothetical protein [Arthrobacter sp. AK01]